MLADGDSAWDAARVPGLRSDVHRVPDGRGPRHQEDRGAHPEAGRVMARNMDTGQGPLILSSYCCATWIFSWINIEHWLDTKYFCIYVHR